MPDLLSIRCVGCEGGVSAMSQEDIQSLLPQTPGWEVSLDAKAITRSYKFKGFYKTMAFVNAVAWVANQENHHPDMEVGYNYCNIKFTTHAVDGLTQNDFICAAKINTLNAELP